MPKTIIVAVVAWIMGAALGFILCHVTISYLRRRIKDLKLELRGKHGKMGTMDKILVLEAVVLICYTVADLIVFWHVGSEPTTLTACVFGVCGVENGVMGWIKTNKDKAAEAARTSGSGQQAAPEPPPTERAEPPDVGL